MKSDQELKETFKVFVDENEIINLVVFKFEEEAEDNTQVAELVKESLFKIFDKNPQKKYLILTDLSSIGKVITRGGFSLGVRKLSVQIMTHKQLKRAAFITPSVFVRVAIKFIRAAAKEGQKIKGFTKKEEAIKWLKEK